MVKKKERTTRRFEFDVKNNVLRQIVERHLEYEMTIEDVQNSINGAMAAIKNYHSQKKLAFKEMIEFQEMLIEYKKALSKFKRMKEVNDEKQKRDRREDMDAEPDAGISSGS